MFTPLKDYVLLRPYVEETKKGSLLLVNKTHENRGGVQQIGSEVRGVAVGDTVLYERYRQQEVTLDNEPYLLIKEENIIGVLS